MRHSIEELLKNEYRSMEVVFEENEQFLIVYEYIEPFICDDVQDDHKGKLNELFKIDKRNKVVTGNIIKKDSFKEQILNLIK